MGTLRSYSIFAVLALTACGGGGGGSNSAPPNSGSGSDASTPTATIIFPFGSQPSTDGDSIVVRGTAADAESDISAVTINGVSANSSDGFANWTAELPLSIGLNNLSVTVEDETGSENVNAAVVSIERTPPFITDLRDVVLATDGTRAYGVDPGQGTLLEINLNTGARSVLFRSDSPEDSNGNHPGSLTLDSTNNRLIFVDLYREGLYELDLNTRLINLISGIDDDGNFFPNDNLPFGNIESLAVNASGTIAYVSSYDPASGYTGLLTVDLSSGQRNLLAAPNFPNPGVLLVWPRDIALDEPNNLAYVTNFSTGNLSVAPIVAVNLTTGFKTIVNTFSQTFNTLEGLVYDSSTGLLYVVDSPLYNYGPPNSAIYSVNMSTNEVLLVSSATTPNSDNPLQDPEKLELDSANNRLLVADRSLDSLIAVNLNDGSRTVVSDGKFNTPNDQNTFHYPNAMAADFVNNRLIVSTGSNDDGYASDLPESLPHLVAVNTLTGERTVLLDTASSFSDLAVDATNNRIFLTNSAEDSLTSLDLDTLELTVVSDNNIDGQPVDFANIYKLVVNSEANTAYVVDTGSLSIIEVNLNDGSRSLLSSNTVPDANNPIIAPRNLALDLTNNRLLIADQARVDSAILAVDLDTGARTILSGNGIPDNNAPLMGAFDLSLSSDGTELIVLDSVGKSILKVDTTTGERSYITNSQMHDGASALAYAIELAVDENKQLAYVMDNSGRSILAIDLVTGARQILSR